MNNTEKADGAFDEVMLPPSREEVWEFNRRIMKLDEALLSKRYDVIGPSLRYLFREKDDLAKKVDIAVEKLVKEGVQAVGLVLRSCAGLKVVHKILYMTGEEEYYFMSRYIAERYFQVLASSHVMDLKRYVLNKGNDPFQRGHSFQALMAQALDKCSTTVEVHTNKAGSSTYTFALHEEKSAVHFCYLSEVEEVHPGVLYYPTMRNFPSVDAFMLLPMSNSPTPTLVFFQMTVAKNHPVKYPGLHRVVRHVNSVFTKMRSSWWAAFPSANVRRSGRLAGVVPMDYSDDVDDNYESYYVGDGKKRRRLARNVFTEEERRWQEAMPVGRVRVEVLLVILVDAWSEMGDEWMAIVRKPEECGDIEQARWSVSKVNGQKFWPPWGEEGATDAMLQQQITRKDEVIKGKDEVIKVKDEALKGKDEVIKVLQEELDVLRAQFQRVQQMDSS